MTTRAFTFPGQGSQAVGMGKAIADASATAREVFEEVNDALSQNLTHLMWEGPEDELTLTENAQPALMAVSLALVRVLQKDAKVELAKAARFVAGHSLGEYSALAAAEALSVADTARLLKTRGQAMQKAVPVGEGAMAALLGVDLETVEKSVVKAEKDVAGAEDELGDEGICVVANDNAPGQVVISGTLEAVEAANARAKDAGARRAMMLPVSAPFHSPLMRPAADAMKEALATARIGAPVVPLVSNVTAEPVQDPDEIRRLLVEQVTGRVRWRESVMWLAANGVEEIVEIGAGRVLTGMHRRIAKEVHAVNIETPGDVDAFLKTL
jgi:[acyl-carrier-protein] S-malonyltransferase